MILPGDPPQDRGEPAIICINGMITNAIFDVIGTSFYQLPVIPERILEGLNRWFTIELPDSIEHGNKVFHRSPDLNIMYGIKDKSTSLTKDLKIS